MGILSNLNVDKDAIQEQDRVGGGGLVDSGIYPARIKTAYLKKANDSQAMGLNVVFDIGNGKELRSQQWITNKNGETFYKDKEGKNVNLMGYNIGNALAVLAVGKALNKLEDEKRVLKLYDFTEKKETNQEVDVVVDLIDAEVILGVVRVKVDKTAKGDDGKYHPTGETKEENQIDKVFCAKSGKYKNMTAAELMAHKKDETVTAAYMAKWIEANEGKVRDRSTKDAAKTGAPKSGNAAPAKPADAEDLFGDDD